MCFWTRLFTMYTVVSVSVKTSSAQDLLALSRYSGICDIGFVAMVYNSSGMCWLAGASEPNCQHAEAVCWNTKWDHHICRFFNRWKTKQSNSYNITSTAMNTCSRWRKGKWFLRHLCESLSPREDFNKD